MKNIIKNRNFLLLLFGQFISVIGDRMSSAVFITIAVAIVNDLTTSFQSSLLLGIQFIPLFLFGYFFGTLADNFKKKNIMIFADVGRAGIILFLFFFHSYLTYLYISVFLLGTFTAMFEPSRKSIIPFIVDRKNLIFLNKIYATMEILAMVIGLGVGAFLLQIISIEDALLFDLGTYLFSLFLILFIKYHDSNEKIPFKKELIHTEKKLSEFFNQLKKGFKYLKNTPNSLHVITNIIFFHFLAAGVLFSTVTDLGIRTSEYFGLKAGSNVSLFLFLIAVGAMLSPIIKKYLLEKYKESKTSSIVFFSGSIIFFLAYIFSAIYINLKLLFVLFFFIGIIAGLQYIRYLYLLHLNTSKKYMGRVVSIAEITISLTVVIGVVFGAYFNEIYTYKYGFLIVSLIYFCGYLSFKFTKNRITW